MKKKLRKPKQFNNYQEFETFSNLMWFVRFTTDHMKQYAIMNELVAVCTLPNTPVESTVWFHVKEAGYA